MHRCKVAPITKGYWYDLLKIMIQYRRSHHNYTKLTALWRDLLESAGLGAIASDILKYDKKNARLPLSGIRGDKTMPSPFPGMNPYLAHPVLWSGVHHRLITAIANDLAPQIRPKYIVAIEERVYQMSGEESLLIGIPDVAVQRPQTTANITKSNITIAAPTAQPIEATSDR